MWPLKTILYFSLFWCFCLMSLVNPIWGVINYMLVYQLNPVNTWWGKPLATFGMRFSMLAALFTLLGVLVGRKHVPKLVSRFSFWEMGIVLLVTLAGILLTLNPGSTESRYAFEKLWKMMLFVLILGRLAATREYLKLVIWSLVVGSLFIGYDALHAPPSAFWLGRLEIIGGPDFSSTSGAAAHLAAMLPLIGLMFLIARKWHWRLLAVLSGALTFNAIILCRTRSAFVGLLCGIFAALLFAPRAKRFRIHVLLIMGGLMAFSLTDVHFWNRMNTLTSRHTLSTDVATVSRMEIWQLSLKILEDHPTGVGPGNFPLMIGRYDPRYYRRSAHNTLLVCFTELGIQGGLLLLLLEAGSVWYLYRCVRLAPRSKNPSETKLIAYGCFIAIVTYVITGLGTERFYCESFWWVLTLPLCLYRVVAREAAVPEPRLALEPNILQGNPTTTWDMVPP